MAKASSTISTGPEQPPSSASDQKSEFNAEERHKLALEECERRVEWYHGSKTRSRRTFFACTVVIMVCGSLTPLFLLFNDSKKDIGFKIPSYLVALPAALSAITSGSQAILNPRRRWTQCAYIEQILRFELLEFRTRCSSKYSLEQNHDAVTEKFLYRIKRIVLEDVRNWGDLMRDPPQPGKEESS